jgi:hypothetical protein
MQRIPKSFQLGCYTFTVKWMSNEAIEKFAGGECWGCIDRSSLLIVLNKSLLQKPHEFRLQTFNHELAHAMLWVANSRDWGKEKVVDAVGHLLVQSESTAKY